MLLGMNSEPTSGDGKVGLDHKPPSRRKQQFYIQMFCQARFRAGLHGKLTTRWILQRCMQSSCCKVSGRFNMVTLSHPDPPLPSHRTWGGRLQAPPGLQRRGPWHKVIKEVLELLFTTELMRLSKLPHL